MFKTTIIIVLTNIKTMNDDFYIYIYNTYIYRERERYTYTIHIDLS